MNYKTARLTIFSIVFISLNSYPQIDFIIPEYCPTSITSKTNRTGPNYFSTYEYYYKKIHKITYYQSYTVYSGYKYFLYNQDTLPVSIKEFDKFDNLQNFDSLEYDAQLRKTNNFYYRKGILEIHDSTYYPNDTTSVSIRIFPYYEKPTKNIRIYNRFKKILVDSFFISDSIASTISYGYTKDTILAAQEYFRSDLTQRIDYKFDSNNRVQQATQYSAQIYLGNISIDSSFVFYKYGNDKLINVYWCRYFEDNLDTIKWNTYDYNVLLTKSYIGSAKSNKYYYSKIIYLRTARNEFRGKSFLLNGKFINVGSSNIFLRTRNNNHQ